ncbi:MAG: hypothetical protein J2O49_04815, partial [Sciscionella sp.]|nr:hypothetical protein [Sciscionella sp.]
MFARPLDAQRPARSAGAHTVRASMPDLLPRARRPVRSNDDRQRDYFDAFHDSAPVEPIPVESAAVEPLPVESPAPFAKPRTPSMGRMAPVNAPTPTGEHSGGWPVSIPVDQPSMPSIPAIPAPPVASPQHTQAVESTGQLAGTALHSNPRLRPLTPTQPATAPVAPAMSVAPASA